MIISASRRTDLPAAHADWLVERFREGFVLVRNPMNAQRVSRVSLRPKHVDGVVFWTKNPAPMLDRLDVFKDYAYYFQFTLTGYGMEVEPNLPPFEKRLDTFLWLSQKIGPERVLWRYDPILLNRKYTPDWHLETFRRYAELLKGATRRATISFVDTYPKNRKRLEALQCAEISEETMRTMAWEISAIARLNGMQAVSCAEDVELIDCGVSHAACIDAELLGRISGKALQQEKDPNQRAACGCAPSVDIGAYNTCPNGCLYCYANYSPALLKTNLEKSNSMSPMLCDMPEETDTITERKTKPLEGVQLKMEF